MADGVNLPPGGTGDTGVKASTQKVTADSSDVQDVALASVVAGVRTRVSAAAPLPVVQTGTPALPTGASTETSVAASATALGAVGDSAYVSGSGSLVALLKGLFAKLPALVSGRVPVDGSGVTQPVSGTFFQATQPVSGTVTATGPLTDTQLRATAVPVSGTVTASGPLTDTQLRASAVPVSGTVTASGPVTDAQLRATPVPVSGTVTANLAAGANNIGDVDVASSVLPTGAATEATIAAQSVLVGSVTETAPVTDTASSGLNGRLQRIASRLTILLGVMPSTIGQHTMATSFAVAVASDQSAVPVSGTVTANAGTGTQAVSLATLPALVAGSANIGDVDVLSLPALPAGSNNIGDVDVLSLPALPAGSNNIGDVDIASITTPTSGGYSVSRLLAGASTNATSVKASAGQVFGWYLANAAAYTVFFKLYNKASAPTVGTDTPFMTIPVPAGSAANVEFMRGLAMGTGVAFATTKLVADADTTVLVANDLVINLLYA
jgi:hypothetical protein